MWELSGIFFATSHGKGTVDSIGSEVMRRVWLANLAGEFVANLQTFYETAKKKRTKTQLIMSAENIEQREVFEKRWMNLSAIPQM